MALNETVHITNFHIVCYAAKILSHALSCTSGNSETATKYQYNNSSHLAI